MSKVRTTTVDLFTPDEHAILASWFGAKPPAFAQDIVVEEAISRLGFDKEPGLYRRIDAAIAFIVLERAEQRLPQWSTVRDDKLILAREYRDSTKIPNRKVVLQPRHLFTINWADSGPGFSWPMAYYVTWLPHYDRYVVTASADCPDLFGYCDFALGAFVMKTPIKKGARKIIVDDWANRHCAGEQPRWAYLFSAELISEQEAEAWAEQVWPRERSGSTCPPLAASPATESRQVLPFRLTTEGAREQRKADPRRQELVRRIVVGPSTNEVGAEGAAGAARRTGSVGGVEKEGRNQAVLTPS